MYHNFVRLYLVFLAMLAGLCLNVCDASGAERVSLWQLPQGAIQPQVAVDGRGTAHVLYFKQGNSEGAGNLYYMRLAPGETRPSESIRVNSEPE